MLTRLIRGNCALIAAHTNADIVESGTSAVLAERIGLVDVQPIVPSLDAGTRHRAGGAPARAHVTRAARPAPRRHPARDRGRRARRGGLRPQVSTVAVCAGAGDAYLSEPAVLGADVYVTSDLRHHPASEARENARVAGGPALIDVSHWASEWLWLESAAAELTEALPGVTVMVSELRTDPWDFAVIQWG